MANQNDHRALSFGALKRILDGERPENIVLQILGYKQIPGSNNSRFRLLLNDGVVLFQYAILATQVNSLIYDNRLEKFTVFKLKDYEYSQLLVNKKVIICLDVEILKPGFEVNEKISEKVSFNTNNSLLSFQNEGNSKLITEPQPSTSNFEPNWDVSQISEFDSVSPTKRDVHFCSICSLSPYHNKWTIRARISYKTSIINYSNSRNQGKYFCFHLLDDSGEIKAVAFNQLVEKFYNQLKLFKIYTVSNASIKPSPENSPVKCDFEMTVENQTVIEPYTGDESSIPMPTFNFKTIRQITSLPKDFSVDVIGVCNYTSDIISIITKSSNKEVPKRTIALIDKSKMSVMVTLWGVHAENSSVADNTVIAIKNAKTSDFRGCSLVASFTSLVYVDPDIHKTAELKSWHDTVNLVPTQSQTSNNFELTASHNWKTLAEVFSYDASSIDTPLYHTTKATIVMVRKESCMYQACPAMGCLKKVHDLNNGQYRCRKCSNDFYSYIWMYLLSFQIADFTGCHWVTAFREAAEGLLGMSADELHKIKTEDEEKYLDILNDLNLKSYIFNLRSHHEIFNDNTQLKTSVTSFSPVEPGLYSRKLLNDASKMSRLLY